MLSRVRFLPLALALGLPIVASGCSKGAAAGADSSKTGAAAKGDDGGGADRSSLSLPVVADEVRDADLVLSVNTTGQVRSDAESKLKSEVAGVVDAVLVHPGDRVKKGQDLVRIDHRSFDLAVREAEAAVSEATLRFLDQFVPDSLATGKGPGEERRRNARVRSGLAGAEVRLEKAKLDLERATITAPFDGVVDHVEVAEGERVQSGQAITTVVDLTNLRIEAAVLEHDLPLIKVNGQAMVSSSASPDRQAIGRVIAVLPIVDSTTRAGRAYVKLPGNGILRPGMYADVRLEATRLANRRLVPSRAVIERDGRPLVFVVTDGRAKWTYINPGRSNGVDTEVLPDSASGQIPVKPGDKVIVEGHLTLTHDAPVRVVASRETPDAPEKKKP